MGILLTIDDSEGTMHNEFIPQTHVSRATITKRIHEAEDLDLIEATQLEDDHGNAKRFFLTQIGRVYRVALESMDLDDAYRDYVDAKQTLDDGMDTMGDWITDNEQFWTNKNLGKDFEFQEPLRDAEIYPGDDVPSDFVDFIEEETSRYEKMMDSLESFEDNRPHDNLSDPD